MGKRDKKVIQTPESKALKKLRTSKGVSVRKLSERIKISHTRVGYYEQGRADVTEEYVEKFLQALELSYEDWNFYLGKNDKSESLRDECHDLLEKIEPSKIDIVLRFLKGFFMLLLVPF